MNLKIIVLISIALIALQMLIAWLVTMASKEFFKEPGFEYAQSIKRLSEKKSNCCSNNKIMLRRFNIEITNCNFLQIFSEIKT